MKKQRPPNTPRLYADETEAVATTEPAETETQVKIRELQDKTAAQANACTALGRSMGDLVERFWAGELTLPELNIHIASLSVHVNQLGQDLETLLTLHAYRAEEWRRGK